MLLINDVLNTYYQVQLVENLLLKYHDDVFCNLFSAWYIDQELLLVNSVMTGDACYLKYAILSIECVNQFTIIHCERLSKIQPWQTINARMILMTNMQNSRANIYEQLTLR